MMKLATQVKANRSRAMSIPIRPIRQEKESCATTCLRMVLSYYGMERSAEELERVMLMEEYQGGRGTVLAELGRCAQGLGLRAACYTYNLQLISPRATFTGTELLRRLEARRPEFEGTPGGITLESTIRCLRVGVRYTVVKPSRRLLASYLGRGIPLIITVNRAALRNAQGDPWAGHDIVLTGYQGDAFSFIDPQEGRQETMAFDDLFFAMLAKKVITQSAYMVVIKPKAITA